MCQEDDVLMWRQIFLFLVADMAAKLKDSTNEDEEKKNKDEVMFLLEQPSDPKDYMPSCVSFWSTEPWKKLQGAAHLQVHNLNQGDYEPWKEDAPVKPTLAANVELRLPKGKDPGSKSRGEGQKVPSSSLARWVPGLCRSVAEACALHINGNVEEEPRLKKMTWEQRCQNGHVPFRRDCRICQEQSAKSRPHRKVTHPLAATLSLDTAGPYPVAKDGKDLMKYILVGTYTWLLPQEQHPPVPDDELADSDEVLLEEEDEDEGDEKCDEEEGGAEEGEQGEEMKEIEVGEEKENPDMITFRLAIPMASKDQKTVLSTIQQMYIQLRVMGYHVARLHTDLGGEFRGRSLTQWRRSRDIHRTTTAGVSSQSNGRAERAIQTVKSHIRRALGMASMPASRWPQACHYVHERERRRMADLDLGDVPPFGHELLVKRRFWKTKELEAT